MLRLDLNASTHSPRLRVSAWKKAARMYEDPGSDESSVLSGSLPCIPW